MTGTPQGYMCYSVGQGDGGDNWADWRCQGKNGYVWFTYNHWDMYVPFPNGRELEANGTGRRAGKCEVSNLWT